MTKAEPSFTTDVFEVNIKVAALVLVSMIVTFANTSGEIPSSFNEKISSPSVVKSFAAVNIVDAVPLELTVKDPVKLVLLISAEVTPLIVNGTVFPALKFLVINFTVNDSPSLTIDLFELKI